MIDASSQSARLATQCEVPCTSYAVGHKVHSIQASLAGRTPWGWRDAIVSRLGGDDIHLTFIDAEGQTACWHHADLSGDLAVGMPVRLHRQFGLLQGPRWAVSVACSGGPDPTPEPANPDLWLSDQEPMIVEVATGRGLTQSSETERSTKGAPVVLVDDVRSFRDGRPCLIARDADAGIRLLQSLRQAEIAELWLDHDLGSDRRTGRAFTIMPVIEELVVSALDGRAYRIGKVFVHTANHRASVAMRTKLEAAGYAVTRWHDIRIWINARTESLE